MSTVLVGIDRESGHVREVGLYSSTATAAEYVALSGTANFVYSTFELNEGQSMISDCRCPMAVMGEVSKHWIKHGQAYQPQNAAY
jgi:hypothetical protein